VAEEGKLAIFSGRAGRGRGGGGFHSAFSGRARQEGVAEEDTGAGRRAAAEGRQRCFLCLDRARPPRLTWAALKPSGLPLGPS